MIENINKRRKMKEIAENVVAVHTHTHTHTVYCLLENKFVLKISNRKSKDRTMLFLNSSGLSFCVLADKGEGLKRYILLNVIKI